MASGHYPDTIADMAKQAGHPSAKRGDVPAHEFVEAIQAERIVEAFEADQWSGSVGDPQFVRDMAESGCWQSHVVMPELTDAMILSIRSDIAEFTRAWEALPLGQSQALDWVEA